MGRRGSFVTRLTPQASGLYRAQRLARSRIVIANSFSRFEIRETEGDVRQFLRSLLHIRCGEVEKVDQRDKSDD